jgi:WD40 repeat protein
MEEETPSNPPESSVPTTPSGPIMTPQKEKQLFTYRASKILHGHKKGISSVEFSPNGQWLASSCMGIIITLFCLIAYLIASDNTVRIWDAFSGKCLHTIEAHSMVCEWIANLSAFYRS